ncbi:MAG TPA: response regulator [Polyangiaceae bacterium]|nr:response regulator [Polyangiaceae bacterium]
MKKLLVVEDSPTQAAELSMLLESQGFAVEVARDGASGLERCRSKRFDAVLSDVVMPEIDGYELCRRIKNDPEIDEVPVILLTSMADPMDIIRGLECGADNFITKPYDAEYLLGRVRRLLDNRAMRGTRKIAMGVDILLMGKKLTINSEKEQILDLLISTFEEVLRARQREFEARLNEETARESQRLLQAALDALSAHIAILDKSGKIVAVNASWRSWAEPHEKIWPDAGVGANYLDLWKSCFTTDKEHIDELTRSLAALTSGKERAASLEYPAKTSKGPGWFAFSATRFGEMGELIAVEQEDITKRRSLEQQLRQSQKMEAIGQLAGGVSHDFNNLLVVITSYTELLLEQFDGADPRRRDLEEILRAASEAASLTRQLLAFSRQQVLRPSVIDLNTVVLELEKMLRRVIGDDIQCLTVLARDLGHVRADPGQMQQILMNLFVNARDAMPRGGSITIETANIALDETFASSHTGVTPGRYVVMNVTDTGSGMDHETQARIFEPFFTTKEVGKGTGLGLSTVYGIVQQSGGHVWVYSEMGRGTSFKIYLPRVDEPIGSSVRPRERESSPARAIETILVVEDNLAIRRVIARILQPLGYQILEASGPIEARQICAEQARTIDLLLTDVVMPEMTGPALAAELGKGRPEMEILFMSGYSRSTMERRDALHPDVHFLEKPFAPEALIRKVRDVLGGVAVTPSKSPSGGPPP